MVFSYIWKAGKTDWIKATHNNGLKYQCSTLDFEDNKVPDLIGTGLRDALYMLENKGIRVKSFGQGRVYWQSITAGNKINQGQTLILKLKI